MAERRCCNETSLCAPISAHVVYTHGRDCQANEDTQSASSRASSPSITRSMLPASACMSTCYAHRMVVGGGLFEEALACRMAGHVERKCVSRLVNPDCPLSQFDERPRWWASLFSYPSACSCDRLPPCSRSASLLRARTRRATTTSSQRVRLQSKQQQQEVDNNISTAPPYNESCESRSAPPHIYSYHIHVLYW